MQLLLTTPKKLILCLQPSDLLPIKFLLVLSPLFEIVVLEVYLLKTHHPLAVVLYQLLLPLTTSELSLTLGRLRPFLELLIYLLGNIGTCVLDETLLGLQLDL